MNLRIKVTLASEKDKHGIAVFIKNNYNLCRDWQFSVMVPWIEWYCAQGYCVIAREDTSEENIVALLMGRPCFDPHIAKSTIYLSNPKGDCFFCDVIITDQTDTLPLLGEMMAQSIGMKDYLAFTRDHGTLHKVHKYSLKKFLKYYAPLARK